MPLTYGNRISHFTNPTAQLLLQIAEAKKSNLILSLDLTTTQACLDMVQACAEQICMLKVHIDILEDFKWDFIIALRALAEKNNFILFEDRKFADIGNTVQLQYQRGIYRIAEWARLITAHSVVGAGLIQGLRDIGLPTGNAMVLLAEMSSSGHLLDSDYREKTIALAKLYSDFVIGFISLRRLMESPDFLYFTPGVQLTEEQDKLGQRYLTPEHVIQMQGTDFIIVGRGIYAASNPAREAEIYRARAWAAYEQRLSG